MTRFWLAGLCLALLAAPGAAMAQTAAAPATAPAAAPARTAAPAAPVAPAAAPAAAPAPAAPAPTGTAAAPPAAGGDWANYNPYSGEENDLNNPNRTQDEIIDWSRQRATEVLSFAPDNIDTKMTANKKAFTAQGLGEYQKYLTDSKLADMVHQQGYSVTTILNGDAMILNSGAMSGNYHWLVELPLMVTFLHSSGVDGEAAQPVAGGNFKLILQLGRVAANQGGVDGMAIESWKMENKATASP